MENSCEINIYDNFDIDFDLINLSYDKLNSFNDYEEFIFFFMKIMV